MELLRNAGIDVRAGLATTMDNHKLYLRLLDKFKEGQADFAALFAAARADADPSAAARAAHTLKGTAGNIGAREVQAAAAELERACLDGEDAAHIEARLAHTLAQLAPVIAGLQALHPPPGAAPVEPAQAQRLQDGLDRAWWHCCRTAMPTPPTPPTPWRTCARSPRVRR